MMMRLRRSEQIRIHINENQSEGRGRLLSGRESTGLESSLGVAWRRLAAPSASLGAPSLD